MRTVCEALWNAFGEKGYSWCGFYLIDHSGGSSSDGTPRNGLSTPGTEPVMLLAARRPKPACSPIGLEGMCGRSWKEQRPVVVRDVRTIADGGYIACDPKDLSEVVVPLIQGGVCWGVLDVDSYEVSAFDQRDVEGLLDVVVRAGLSDPLVASPESTLNL